MIVLDSSVVSENAAAASDLCRELLLSVPAVALKEINKSHALSVSELSSFLGGVAGGSVEDSRYRVLLYTSDQVEAVFESGESWYGEHQQYMIEQAMCGAYWLVDVSPSRGDYIRKCEMPPLEEAVYWREIFRLARYYSGGLNVVSPFFWNRMDIMGTRDQHYMDYLQGYLARAGVPAGDVEEKECFQAYPSSAYGFLPILSDPGLPEKYRFLAKKLFQLNACSESLFRHCTDYCQHASFGFVFDDPEGITGMLVDDEDEQREGSFFLAVVTTENLLPVLRALGRQEKILEEINSIWN